MPGYDDHDLERALRAQRPEARDEFVQNLAAAVRSRRHSAPRPRFGLAFALSSILVSLAVGKWRSLERPAFLSAAALSSRRQRQRIDVAQGQPSDHSITTRYSSVCQRIPRIRRQIRHWSFPEGSSGARLRGRFIRAGGVAGADG